MCSPRPTRPPSFPSRPCPSSSAPPPPPPNWDRFPRPRLFFETRCPPPTAVFARSRKNPENPPPAAASPKTKRFGNGGFFFYRRPSREEQPSGGRQSAGQSCFSYVTSPRQRVWNHEGTLISGNESLVIINRF